MEAHLDQALIEKVAQAIYYAKHRTAKNPSWDRTSTFERAAAVTCAKAAIQTYEKIREGV